MEAIAFDKVSTKLLGISAEKIKQMQQENNEEYGTIMTEFENLQCQYLVEIQAKESNYYDPPKLQLIINSVEKVQK